MPVHAHTRRRLLVPAVAVAAMGIAAVTAVAAALAPVPAGAAGVPAAASVPAAAALAGAAAPAATALAAGTDSTAWESPVDVQPTPPAIAARIAGRDWWEVLEQDVPPLRHDLGRRWPLIVWHGPGSAPLSPDRIRLLRSRGLTQHLPLDSSAVPAALALQREGARVILMEGRSGNWPYSLAGDSTRWALQFEPGYTYDMAGTGALGSWHSAVPVYTEGWAVMADQVRRTLRAFRSAGVTVDGIWTDYETDPYPFAPLFEQLRHCQVCRQLLPAAALADRQACFAYCWRQYTALYDAYLAAPALEIFPQCAVTNWHIVFSSPQHPVYYFVDNRVIPPVAPVHMTASNPVVYGTDTWFVREWQPGWVRDRRHVDQFYTHNLLRQVSADAATRAAFAPNSQSFPWVSRFCPMEPDTVGPIPDVSRRAWREALRHLWLRGVDGMQVFNPRQPTYEEIWLQELQDAVAIYDEMLAHADLLDSGRVMNLEIPGPQDLTVFWSGLQLGDRAVVRVTNPGPAAGRLPLEPWPGLRVDLPIPADSGQTWLLERTADRIAVLPQPQADAP